MSRKPRIAYILKRYPRYSETFIVNEILAHEAAGLAAEIFALRHPNDTHFQDAISRVRAPVTYLPTSDIKASDFWKGLKKTMARFPVTRAAVTGTTNGAPRRSLSAEM